MKISDYDRDILRTLAAEQSEIAALPVHKGKIKLWKNLNSLKSTRPMLWINEIPWKELTVDDELTLKCRDEFCRELENKLRMCIYQWKHMRGDMIVEPVFVVPMAINDSGFGIEQHGDTIKDEEGEGVLSQEFIPQISEIEDVTKIKMPEITLDKELSQKRKAFVEDIFGDILEVKLAGIGHQWFTLWDYLIRWYGVEEAMMDLVLKPEVVHAALQRLLDAFICRLEQYEKLNILELCNGNNRVGSGGLGYCDELPSAGFNASQIRTLDQWGCGNAQIFSEVSPAMHEEFSLQYERKWLERFGLVYYGCCEPLHNKIEILRSIPNLRKISMSPWCKVEKMVGDVGNDYVLSHKPNPAILARDEWNPGQARKELTEVLEKTRGCQVEVILKDISTVRNDPHRLWDWCRIAEELVENYN
jgi:hypothetical protein